PKRFMHVFGITAATLAAAGWHTAANEAGATGGLKQFSFKKSLGFPGLTGFPSQPGPHSRSGKGYGVPPWPVGFPAISTVIGVPVEAVNIPPVSQPPRMYCATAPPTLGWGISQV